MNSRLFVVVMPISREDKHNNLRVVNFIDQSMLVGDAAALLPAAVALQLFRLTRTSARMLHEFLQ